MKAIDIRQGAGIKMDGKLCVVTLNEHRTPGNLRAFVQLTYKDVVSGKTLSKRLQPSEDIEIADLDRRPMEYLYSDHEGATFMDLENYEQMVVSKSILGDALMYLRENTQVVVLCNDGNPVTLELPAAVELIVKDTSPGIKGATATNQMKEATMETGLKTRVPPFIAVGEALKISTVDGSYMQRAKE
jgi:elongation factor P